MTDKQWETMLAVHNTAPFKLVRAAAPYFRVKDGEPRVIINISSTSGIHGNAYASPPPSLPLLSSIRLTLSQRPSKLLRRQSRRRGTYQDDRERMGPCLRCPG